MPSFTQGHHWKNDKERGGVGARFSGNSLHHRTRKMKKESLHEKLILTSRGLEKCTAQLYFQLL